MRASGLQRQSLPAAIAAHSRGPRRLMGGLSGRIGVLHGAPGIEWITESLGGFSLGSLSRFGTHFNFFPLCIL